jgi:hypothetical protein
MAYWRVGPMRKKCVAGRLWRNRRRERPQASELNKCAAAKPRGISKRIIGEIIDGYQSEATGSPAARNEAGRL